MIKIIDYFIGDIPPEQRTIFMRFMFRGMFLFHIIWACGWLSAFGVYGFAKAGEVEDVKKDLTHQIDAVEKKVDDLEAQVVKGQKLQLRTAMETELRRLNQEIFAYSARLKELTEAGLRADRIYEQRVSDLQEERERVEVRLQAFLRSNPDIIGATF